MAQVAERALEVIRHDGAFDHDTNGFNENNDPVYEQQQRRSGDHGTQFIIKMSLRSVEIIAMFSISILNYHLFVVTGTKFCSVRYSKSLHSTPWMSYWIQSHPNILEQSVLVI